MTCLERPLRICDKCVPIRSRRLQKPAVTATVDRMPRRARKLLDGHGLFHVTARGAGGCMIFRDDVDRLNLADCFWDAVLAFELRCIVVVQVGTHYHAVLEASRDRLSEGMRKLNGSYARRFNVRHERRGHLFEARFSSWVIESERHLAATVPYVLWNPVRAGLCQLPSEWEWSWLEPARAATAGPELVRADSSDCPMGQSLVRARKRQRQARLKEQARARSRAMSRGAAAAYREQDEL